jgi:predicted RNase H-like nuclease (RuvC/YqgF family)
MLETSNTSMNDNFKTENTSLRKDINAMARELNQLEQAVKMIERRRADFPHIDDAELNNRKKFVTDFRATLRRITETMQGSDTLGKLERDARKSLTDRGRGGSRLVGSGGYEAPAGALADLGASTDTSTFVGAHQSQQQEIYRVQDEHLEELSKGASRLGEMADTIHNELSEQDRMLSDLEDGVQNTSAKMDFVTGRIGKLLNTKSRCKIWTIVLLTVVLVILIFCVFYT